MDLQSALRINGGRWRLARIGVFLCFALACGLLVVSLASPSKAFAPAKVPQITEFSAAR
jgi:hypothetical protein